MLPPAAAAATAAAASPKGSGHEDACSVLLDVRAYSVATKNASTARSKTSTGHTIVVTFCIMPPPALSHISVHCPDLQLPPDDLSLAPRAVAAADDLVLLRVPVNPLGSDFFQHNDYFVYRGHHQHPKLDLLPNPWPYCFGDTEIAILRCGAITADDDNQYVVAALTINPPFELHMYRSKPGGETGSWTVQPVSVEKPLRDSVCPIPDTAKRLMYHLTTNVITLGGANGTIGWVDLWRGILLCDVLEESPKLRDIPLPLPAKGNRRRYLRDSERFVRDITVSQHKDSIKYVEMEINPPRVVNTISTPDSVTYHEWVRPKPKDCLPQPIRSLAPGQWKATTWSMPIPVTSCDDWLPECTAQSHEFHVGNPKHYELLQELMSSSGAEEVKEATLSLGFMHMGYPVFSIDDDVVYLSCKAASRGMMGLVVAVDVRKKELQGVAKLDIERNTCLMRCYIATEISKYLKTTDESLQAISSELGPAVGANVISDVATANLGSHENIVVDGLDNVLEKMFEETTTGSTVDFTDIIGERNDGKTSADPVSHETNVAHTMDNVDEKNEQQSWDRTSSIGTMGGIGNVEDKHSEETAADPRSVENATTSQVTFD